MVGVFVVFGWLLASASFAQVSNNPADDSAANSTANVVDNKLTILITASRFAQTADETLAPVTVITADDIAAKQANTVEEVLRSIPGITFGNSGGVGKQTSLFLRGTNSNHVLVLVDGVKTGNVHSGAFKFENMPVSQIERIEVVRGPRSSLYGSEAIGGVVQIFTRKGSRDAARADFSAELGSHNSSKFNVGASGGDGDKWISFNTELHSTGGYDACINIPGNNAGCGVNEPDADGFENKSVAIRGGVDLTEKVSLEGSFLQADVESEYDGFSADRTEDQEQIATVKLTAQVRDSWQSLVTFGQSDSESQNFNGDTKGSFFNSKRTSVSWQNDFQVSDNNRAIVGVDHIEDDGDIGNGFGTTYDRDRDSLGIFGLWRSKVGNNDFEVSARHDDDDEFGNHETGSIAWGRDFANNNRMTASFGTGFKSPTFNQLYSPDNAFCFGGGNIYRSNTNLEPEKSRTVNFGFINQTNSARWALNIYKTEIRILISSRVVGQVELTLNDCTGEMADVNQQVNVNKAEIYGFELSGDVRFGNWNIVANFSVQDAEEASGERDGEPLARRPKTKVNLDISRQFNRWSWGANIHGQSETEIDYVGSQESPISGFGVLDLRAAYKFNKDWSVGFKINNALNKKYETAAFYPQDRRNYLLTIRYMPQN